MKRKFIISEEEFGAIKEAIEEVLSLWHYDFISAKNVDGAEISMSKETFFEGLKREFLFNEPHNT